MSFTVKGWCPGAWRPMESGDGLVLRIRPRNGRLLPAQTRAIADLSARLGNGLIDLTNRANLQLRGLDAAGHEQALAVLADLDLLDPTPQAEAQRNIILSPFAPMGSPAWQAAEALAAALTTAEAPQLPAKFGFTVETDPPVLQDAPADIRLYPQGAGWLVLPQGADWALPAQDAAQAARRALDLARWFLKTGTRDGRGRMREHLRQNPLPPADVLHLPAFPFSKYPCDDANPQAASPPAPGPVSNGRLLGFAFGQITAAQLAAVEVPLRLTPWRMLLLETSAQVRIAGAIEAPDDPLLRSHACTGAPGCPQALAPTRDLARRLAPLVQGSLHVSGCAKGCAHRGPASVTLVAANPDAFDLIRDGRPGHPPQARLPSTAILRLLGAYPRDMTAKNQGPTMHRYETDGAAIYRQSFATIRAEADLARFSPEEEPVVVRMIHAAGLVGLERDVVFSPGMTQAARKALEAGAPILCDARMVSEGITRARLPAENRVVCTLQDPRVPDLAARMGNTRSAAALELWRDDLAGAVVAIGNAPTALFHLLNMLKDPACPRPAAIIGCPVGFVGAAESKDALLADLPAPSLIVRGRLGGSAITVAAVNALASRKE